MVLVMTDAFTKYAEAIAIPNKEAETVAMEIFIHWICRFGSPVQIHSDNGTEFVNRLSKELFKLLDIKHTTTTPGHPQCNAQAEVFNKTMAKYLASFVDESTLDWEQFLVSGNRFKKVRQKTAADFAFSLRRPCSARCLPDHDFCNNILNLVPNILNLV